MPAIFFQDYFESYPLGPTGPGVPAGFDVGAFISEITLGGIDNPASKCWRLTTDDAFFNGRQGYAVGDYVSEFSLFQALRPNLVGQSRNSFGITVFNASDTTHQFLLLRLSIEPDGTITLATQDGFGNFTLIGNTGRPNTGAEAFALSTATWAFMQLNVIFSRTATIPPSVNHNVEVACDFAVDGVPLISNSVNSGAIAEALPVPNDPPPVNAIGYQANFGELFLPGGNLDSMTVQALVPINTFPIPGMPVAHALQFPIEVVERPNDSQARDTQLMVELAELPTSSKARATQLVVELMTKTQPRTFWFPEYRRPRRGW